jgi:type II secretory pathway pseudopilin PulG
MIGLVLLGIVTGITVPVLQGQLRRQRLREAATALASRIEAARHAALRSNQPCELSLGDGVLRPAAGSGSCGEPPVVPLDLGRHGQGATIRVSGDDTSFHFTAGGMLSGSPDRQTLELSLDGFQPRTCVSVERPSALVRIGSADARASGCRFAG